MFIYSLWQGKYIGSCMLIHVSNILSVVSARFDSFILLFSARNKDHYNTNLESICCYHIDKRYLKKNRQDVK